jgi:hypothetical protein
LVSPLPGAERAGTYSTVTFPVKFLTGDSSQMFARIPVEPSRQADSFQSNLTGLSIFPVKLGLHQLTTNVCDCDGARPPTGSASLGALLTWTST